MFQNASSEFQRSQLRQIGLTAALANHEYWRRRWIVQEIALARSVTVR